MSSIEDEIEPPPPGNPPVKEKPEAVKMVLNPTMYSLPTLKFKHLPPSNIRGAWKSWLRWFETIMEATYITDGAAKKVQMLALGGSEIQEVYFGLPDDLLTDEHDPYKAAKKKLDDYFAPQQHAVFERYNFWSIVPELDEPIEKFVTRVQKRAESCKFGKDLNESRNIAIIDKIIMHSPQELKEKLLSKETLNLSDMIKTINAYQSVKQQTQLMNTSTFSANSQVNRIVNKTSWSQSKRSFCNQCGRYMHTSGEKCPAADKECRRCNIKGHFERKCRTKMNNQRGTKRNYPKDNGQSYSSSKRRRQVYNIESDRETDGEEAIYNVGLDEETILCKIGGTEIEMLIDSGSKYNIIDDRTWSLMKIRNVDYRNARTGCGKRFLAYGKVPLVVETVFDAEIKIQDGDTVLSQDDTFYVIKEGQQPLLGKRTAKKLGVLVVGLPNKQPNNVNTIDTKKKKVFPKIKGVKVQLPIDQTVHPIKQPLRRCPIPLLPKVKETIMNLLDQDIIERVVKPSAWVSPLVPILKDNGELRICIDMRRANEAIGRLNHPLPTMDDFLPQFKEATFFTSLDIEKAFHQVEIEEKSREITTFITNWGLFRYKRLLFGVNCAPELFQGIMERILVECPNTVNFIDDILIYGKTEKEHDRCLKKTLETLKQNNIKLNDHKCKYKMKEVCFLGHLLSESGISPSKDKVSAILNCREPKTKEELRSFLGLVTYVSKFIPDLATLNYSLRIMNKQDSKFDWGQKQQEAFDNIKRVIASPKTLGYYDPLDRTLVVADASGVGLGAVLIQFKGNNPRVICYASKSLTETEMRYPTIEKEALGLVWAVERFRMYLLGISFELETDHQPLERLFRPSSTPSARIERWVLRLQSFRFKVKYRKGATNLADPLSRLASHVEDKDWDHESQVFLRRIVVQNLSNLVIDEYDEIPFDSAADTYIRLIQEAAAIDIWEIVKATKSDDSMQEIRRAIENDNWNRQEIKAFCPFKDELSYVNDLVIRGSKLVIPTSLRERMITLAHEGHPGQVVMKRRLRDRCWWPGMDKEASKKCDSCEGCRLVQSTDPPEPMSRRPLPNKAWVDLAIDFLGPLPDSGESILIIVDYFSRYFEFEIMTRITASDTIRRLDKIFRRLGYPHTITLDNGRQFASKEFEDYCKLKNIHLNFTTPYWPQENGQVERQNRSLLKRLRISHALHGDWKQELGNYLELYYTTPHSTTGKTPTELMFGRTNRSKIPRFEDIEAAPLLTDFADKDKVMKFKGKNTEDLKRNAAESDIKVGDEVLAKNMKKQNKLSTNFLKEKFSVIERKGSCCTIKSLETGKEYERNTSHLKKIINHKSTSEGSTHVSSKKELNKISTDFSKEKFKMIENTSLQSYDSRQIPASNSEANNSIRENDTSHHSNMTFSPRSSFSDNEEQDSTANIPEDRYNEEVPSNSSSAAVHLSIESSDPDPVESEATEIQSGKKKQGATRRSSRTRKPNNRYNDFYDDKTLDEMRIQRINFD